MKVFSNYQLNNYNTKPNFNGKIAIKNVNKDNIDKFIKRQKKSDIEYCAIDLYWLHECLQKIKSLPDDFILMFYENEGKINVKNLREDFFYPQHSVVEREEYFGNKFYDAIINIMMDTKTKPLDRYNEFLEKDFNSAEVDDIFNKFKNDILITK